MTDEIKKLLITQADIVKSVEQGYPVTCATCVHFYAACAMNLPSCGKAQCGGPIVGRDFPDYKGQIPRNKFSQICLMCGNSKLYCHVVVPGKEQRFGLCLEHKDCLSGVVTNPEINLPQSSPLIIPLN